MQKDYVGCYRSNTRHKKSRNKKRIFFDKFKITINLIIFILIIFIGILYSISYNKSGKIVILSNFNKDENNNIPPKPGDQWHYIKKLDGHQNSEKEVNFPVQITDEQHRQLKQAQTDVHQKTATTLSNEVIHDDQSILSSVEDVAQEHMKTQSPYNIFNKPPAQSPTQKNTEIDKKKKISEEESSTWLVQCGFFQKIDQAESIRALLAFSGIESRVVTDGTWSHVLLGPYSNRIIADKILQSIHNKKISHCALKHPE